jgi:glutaredoxin 3
MVKIEMYTTAVCPYCVRAKQLLMQKNVKFTEIRVDLDEQKRDEMIQRSQRKSVPQIFINDQHIGGCDDLYALDKAHKLDVLLSTK